MEWIAPTAAAITVVAALVAVGVRLGKVEAKIAELDRDVAALVPIATEITRAVTEMHAISSLITSHMSADGHVWTVKAVARLEERLSGVANEVQKLEKRDR